MRNDWQRRSTLDHVGNALVRLLRERAARERPSARWMRRGRSRLAAVSMAVVGIVAVLTLGVGVVIVGAIALALSAADLPALAEISEGPNLANAAIGAIASTINSISSNIDELGSWLSGLGDAISGFQPPRIVVDAEEQQSLVSPA